MRYLLIAAVLCLSTHQQLAAQGCVAVRSNGNTCSLLAPEDAKGWQLNLNNRYYRSYKHFVGTEEQKHRVENGTEVINYSYSLDITLTRNFNSQWSIALTLPYNVNVRSSMYEHYGNTSTSTNARNKTRSNGLGDIRIVGYKWLLDPQMSHKANIQVGLGLKLPTGNYEVKDYFHKPASTGGDSLVLGPVDQSIQLGDGGTGIITELNGFYNLNHTVGLYATAFYQFSPVEQNGVSTARGGTPNANAIKYQTSTMSVADQYLARLGVSYMRGLFNASAGLRLEGIPAYDLIGGSRGFRRPGYILSAEPVVAYNLKKTSIYLSVPVALQRDRVQSRSDKMITRDTGNKTQGDAAFADYFINMGVSIRF